MSRVSIIAAIGKKTRVLGRDNDLVFRIKEDLVRFRELTHGHPVVMGRKTWESLPPAVRPLPGRANFVVTRQKGYDAPGALVCESVEAALKAAERAEGADEVFIIGGGEIYALALPHTNRLYLTLVESDAEGDIFFPEYAEFTQIIARETHSEHEPPYEYITLERA